MKTRGLRFLLAGVCLLGTFLVSTSWVSAQTSRAQPSWLRGSSKTNPTAAGSSAERIIGRELISSSNAGPDRFSGININQFLGADRFYNNGFTGSTAILANIEAGHARSDHEALSHITEQITGTGALGSVRSHPTSATHAMSGRLSANNFPTDYHGYGIGYGAETWSGAIATEFLGGGSFRVTGESTASTYATILQTGVNGRTADVFNSSWGFSDPTGTSTLTRGVDALLNDNGKIGVISAGNSGSGTNRIGGMGSGYNAITVGALRTDTDASPYNRISSFSSRGPNDFFHAGTGETITAVRAVVDIAAPGQNLTLATSESTTSYDDNLAGTSFSAPLVAGGAGLVVDAGKQLYGTSAAIDGRVVKAVLMNSADKTSGWDNGQSLSGGVVRTTQSLDYAVGAGRMNLDRAFDQYVLTSDGGMAGTADVAGLGSGDLGYVGAVGWDYGQVVATAGSENRYFIESRLLGGSEFNATLTWFADRLVGSIANFSGAAEDHLANLDLEIFRFDNLVDRNILELVAVSESLYNVSEHLSFLLPRNGYYGINVRYTEAHWDFGEAESGEQYGLAWSGVTAVPEPGAISAVVAVIGVMFWTRRRRPDQAVETES